MRTITFDYTKIMEAFPQSTMDEVVDSSVITSWYKAQNSHFIIGCKFEDEFECTNFILKYSEFIIEVI